MTEASWTVERAAKRLQLHPKTVLRLIHEGRLRGTRIGKAYRILQSDLDAFVGASPLPTPRARVTSIVDISHLSDSDANRITTAMQASLLSGNHADAIQLSTAYDTTNALLKLVVIAPPGLTADVLRSLDVYLEGLS
ncbi:helix-turn-helix domain-containing protein [Dyella sp.]|uniref:helix-turn-helix domain-containing protein n=1 Tax=Dyella sp. TaxID=1869338 RepID=UPI002ED61C11